MSTRSLEERYPVQYDDLFVYAPSFALWEELCDNGDEKLFEGKYVGKSREVDLVLLDRDRTMDAFLRPEKYAQERKVGVTVGKRRFKDIQERTHTELWNVVRRHDKGLTEDDDFKREATKIMKRAWKESFLAGIRSTGIAGRGQGLSGVELAPDDEKWLKSAMSHEMRFLNKFVTAISEQSYKMPLDRRTKMYVDALESFYDSARVIGLPATSVLRWTGKKDKKVCASCVYLHKHNPYHKRTLPTVPRAGLTICLCLTDCRVDILTRRGRIPWRDVRVGDLVWTHRRRWRLILAKPINHSLIDHRYAVIVGDEGKLFGVTDDHLVFTDFGWVSARDAASAGLLVRRSDRSAESDGFVSSMLDAASMDWRCRIAKAACTPSSQGASETSVRGPTRETFLSTRGRAVDRAVLAPWEEALHLSVSVAMGACEWPDSRWACNSPSRRRSRERQSQQFAIEGTRQARTRSRSCHACACKSRDVFVMRDAVPVGAKSEVGGAGLVLLGCLSGCRESESSGVGVPPLREEVRGSRLGGGEGPEAESCGRFLLSDLLRRASEAGSCDLAVRRLSEELQEMDVRSATATVQVGQVLLLQGVLPVGSPLYDLTVEEDASFTAAGVVVHNSNCRDRLLVRVVESDKALEVLRGSKYTRDGHVRNLLEIKRLRELPARLA